MSADCRTARTSPRRSWPRPGPGEQVEAYVGRIRETEIRVYQGEVENFTCAQSEGIGIRVITDGRTGFAYAGTLDASAIDEVLAEARDNVAFGTPDEWAGLAEPDGVAVQPIVLWNEALVGYSTADKIELAKELERLARALDPRVRVEESNYADALSRDGGGHVHRHPGRAVARTAATSRSRPSPTTVTRPRPASASPSAATPTSSISAKAAREASDRATRLLGAVKPSSRRLTVVLDPYVTAQFLGIIAGTLNGEAVLKGRSIFANRLGEQVAAPGFTLVDDPTNPLAYTATEVDGEGPRGPAQRRSSRTACCSQFVQSSYSRSPQRHRLDRQRRAGRIPGHAGLRVPGDPGHAGHPLAGRADRRDRRRRADPDGAGPPLGRELGVGRLLHRRVRAR